MTSGTPAAKRPYAARMPLPQRREQLLDAALDIALERGFHAVTIDGVARACGVTRPVVYGLFADRTAILDALTERSEARTLVQLAAVFPPLPAADADTDPDELTAASITAYLEVVMADPRTWRVILLPPEGAPAEMTARVTEHRKRLLGQLRELVAWGLERRGGPALDPDLFARAVFTLSEGAASLLLADPQRWSIEQFADFTRTALRALRPDA